MERENPLGPLLITHIYGHTEYGRLSYHTIPCHNITYLAASAPPRCHSLRGKGDPHSWGPGHQLRLYSTCIILYYDRDGDIYCTGNGTWIG